MSLRTVLRRLDGLDRVALGLLALGLVFVATGALPVADAQVALWRIADILLFLVAVVVLAELLALAQVFDVIATRLAILGRGYYPALFAVCVLLAALTTMFLNLDTTAVLLTPVMLALARQAGASPLPFAMATVWFANLASLLLPVSNLTNLLAADRVGLSPLGFAQRMAWPQAVTIVAGAACLWVFFWRRGVRGADRYTPPQPVRPAHRTLFVLASVDAVAFAVLVLAGVHLWLASVLCAGLLAAAFLRLHRPALTWGLLPWRLVVMVVGLFLVVGTVNRWGLDGVLAGVVGTDGGSGGVWRAAGAGAVLSNLVNNLPAYVAGEAAVPVGNPDQLLGLLIGTNLGPLVTPWASLATLIWFDTVRRKDVHVPVVWFVVTGAVTAAVTLTAAVAALLLTA